MRRVTFERRNFLHQPEEDEDPERSWVADQHRRDRRRNECFGRYRKKDGGYNGTAQQPRRKRDQPDHLSGVIKV